MSRSEVLQLVVGAVVERPEPATWARLKLGGSAKNPSPRLILENVAAIFESDSRWMDRLWFDVFRGSVMVDDAPITDHQEAVAALWLSRVYDLPAKPALAGEGMRAAAHLRQRHPVREYLEGLSWDGVPRLDGWLCRYLGAAPGALTGPIGRCFAISAVARVMQPGCKVDTVLILVGGQGAGKSTALRTLGGRWFSDTPIAVGSKDTFDQINGIWLYELAELDAFRRAEWPAIKALISSPEDNVRRAYGRHASVVRRQGIFVGTTNRSDFLSDSSGSRRFWPITVGTIDLAALREDRDQLWAEAVARYQAGEPWWLSAEQDRELAREAEGYEATDPWQATIAAWVDGRPRIEIAQVISGALEKPAHQATAADAHRVGAILAGLGYHKRRAWAPGGRRVTYWERGGL